MSNAMVTTPVEVESVCFHFDGHRHEHTSVDADSLAAVTLTYLFISASVQQQIGLRAQRRSSNGGQIAVESKSDRSCNHRISGRRVTNLNVGASEDYVGRRLSAQVVTVIVT